MAWDEPVWLCWERRVGRGRLITYPLCQLKGWDSYLRCVVFRDSKMRSYHPMQEALTSANPGCSPMKTPLVFQAFSSPPRKWIVAGIYKRCS